MRLVTRVRHLARRAMVSAKGRAPDPAALDRARAALSAPEWALFVAMTPTDQAHASEVADRVLATWSDGAPPPEVVAAALLHDVGKVDAGLGTPGRIVATLIGPVVPARVVPRLGRVGRHLGYPDTGRRLLEAAGSAPVTSAWAAEHHLDPDRWTVPRSWGVVLRAADDAAS